MDILGAEGSIMMVLVVIIMRLIMLELRVIMLYVNSEQLHQKVKQAFIVTNVMMMFLMINWQHIWQTLVLT